MFHSGAELLKMQHVTRCLSWKSSHALLAVVGVSVLDIYLADDCMLLCGFAALLRTHMLCNFATCAGKVRTAKTWPSSLFGSTLAKSQWWLPFCLSTRCYHPSAEG